VTVYTELGDVTCDGYINIADATSLIDYILGSESAISSTTNADTNSDGVIGIADVTSIIDYILTGGIWPWDEPQPVTETFTVNGVTFTMVAVEGGTFTMGATAEQGSDAWQEEKPAHQVTLSSYCIGQTEVTQALWQAVMGSNPSYFNGGNYGTNLQRPVEQVSWNDCQTFITKLNQMTGKTFRLPTEAEWEFAARGGKLSQGYKYAGSNTIGDVAWHMDNIPSQTEGNAGYGTQTVATKAPNELGLYDMSGNVFEWCQDWYSDVYYSSSPSTNPTGPTSGSFRVLRGGGWGNDARHCRVLNRDSNSLSRRNSSIGLRLALGALE
jgi:formylglycine-generating enzyme required for sulfatase activity